MRKFKTLPMLRLTMLMVGAMLAVGFICPIVAMAQDKPDAAKVPDAQSQHVEQQTPSDENLAAQLGELRDKVGRLETLVGKSLGAGMTSDPSGGMEPTGGKSGGEGMSMMGQGGKGMSMMGQGGQGMGGGKGMGMMGQGGKGMGGGESEMGGSASQQLKKLMLKLKIKKIELEMIKLELQMMEVK